MVVRGFSVACPLVFPTLRECIAVVLESTILYMPALIEVAFWLKRGHYFSGDLSSTRGGTANMSTHVSAAQTKLNRNVRLPITKISKN